MEALVLCFRGEPLRQFALGARALDVGCGEGCDVVVHDPELAERHLRVVRDGETMVVQDLRRSGGRLQPPTFLAPGQAFAVGRDHSLVWVPAASGLEPRTDPVATLAPSPPLSVVLGRGADARSVAIEGRSLSIGTAFDNDIRLADRTVSAHHCRLEPDEYGVLVRDLGSRNGTSVDGVRVASARAEAGSHIRVGRTDLVLVPRGTGGDARGAGMVARSPAMLRVLGEVERFARLRWPVLILGESGVGKEGVARALHDRGPRTDKPFVAINAGGLPRELIESELFGHERGAFTGAIAAHRGVFEQAQGGTLFLDEIGELPLALQARLLRVLETWELRRVGGERLIHVDVRLLCATHRDLRALIAEGAFREDLYYRLARLIVTVPPLRDRLEDVRALANHFLEEIARDVGPRRLSPRAVSRLRAHRWPGNARELRNVLCSAAADSAGQVLEEADVQRALERFCPELVSEPLPDNLHSLLERHGGNISAAARALGIPRSTLRDRLRGIAAAKPRPADATSRLAV